MMHRVVNIINDQPVFATPLSAILAECRRGGAIEVLDPVAYHTAQQRKWYKGVCLRGLSEWNGETPEEWDYRLKALCGGDLLKTQSVYLGQMSTGKPCVVDRLTITGVGKRNMTAFIENILSQAITHDWPVTPPDEELRT